MNVKRLYSQMLAAPVAAGGLSACLPAKSWAIYGVKVYIERSG